jgi:hypothetical protein
MNLLSAIKQRLTSGDVPIDPSDEHISKTTLMDPKLLMRTLKPYARRGRPVKIAMYPHKEGNQVILIQDICEVDPFRWTAVSPHVIVMEEL